MVKSQIVINPNGNIISGSTFSSNAIQISNNSTEGQTITKVRFDLKTALLPDLVFDPNKTAGDSAGRGVTINSNSDAVGYLSGSGEYFESRDGGFDVLELSFDDFKSGQTFIFGVDTDPTSINGTTAPGPGDSGSISGLELVGATVTVEFDDGTITEGQVYQIPESNTGSQVTLDSDIQSLPQPTIEVLGLSSSSASVSDANQTVRISGSAGTDVSLLIVEGALFLEGDGFDIDPFEANTAIGVNEISATIGTDGFVDIPVTLTNSDPDGGLNYLVAVTKDADGNTSSISSKVILELQEGNSAPTTTGIADVAVVEGADNTVIPLFEAFADAEDGDSELTYTIASNSNQTLFDNTSIDAATGELTLDYAATGTGNGEITVRATDTEGLFVDTTFAVNVAASGGNSAPTTTGIADVAVVEGADNTVIPLFEAFADAEDADSELTYTIASNSNQTLFDNTSIDAATGELTLDYAATGTGNGEITVRATDTQGLFVDTTFVVSSATPATDDIIRINSGGGNIYDPNGNLWQADDFFTGGQVFDESGRPITNADDDFRFDSLYNVQRSGDNFSYAIPVDNGTYTINLHLAELVFDTNDQRIFDVSLEGDVAFDNIDIYSRTKNAFLDGKDTARVLQLDEVIPPPSDVVIVEDGVLNIDFSSDLGNATIGGLEIIPVTTPQIVVRQTEGTTEVSEAGASDTYEVVLTTQPSDDVTIDLQVDGQLTTDIASLTFDSSNWNVAQTVTVSAVDDTQEEGVHFADISHTVSTTDSNYSGLDIPTVSTTITDNDTTAIDFTTTSISTINQPTRAAWGPDGRLYVASLKGNIAAYTFDDNYNVTATQNIDTIVPLENHEILGIAFNPYDTEPKIYVAHNHLEANGGKPFPETEFSPYSGQISVLEGSDFATLTPLITGLPVSNHDHGVNGIEFDNNGDLYFTIGSNTNAGIVSEAIGGLDESPFTAAVIKAEITKPDFNGTIKYTLPDDFVPPSGLSFDPADSQVFGDVANVAPGVDVSVYATGTRNPFDLVYTTEGLLYATDNGANFNAGDASTGANTETQLGGKQLDELNLIEQGNYYGSPNRNRGRTDSRQNTFYGTVNPYQNSIPGVFTEPIGVFGKNSTNGIDEYRANTFNGQLKGNLIAHEFNSKVWSVDLSPDGTQVEEIVDLESINNGEIADGLDILTGPGGSIVGVDLQGDQLTIAIPNDPNVTNPTAYDIFPWRAPAVGGQEFIIGGVNFDPSDTSVFIGNEEITNFSVSENRIRGIIPNLSSQPDTLLDVTIESGGTTSIISEAFQPLFV